MKLNLFFIFLLFFAAGCNTSKNVPQDGYVDLREVPAIKPKFSNELTVNYKLYIQSDTVSICFVEINPENLLQKRDDLDNWSRSAEMRLVLKKNPLSKEVIFDQTKTWTIRDQRLFIDSFYISMPSKTDLWCEITFTDQNKHTFLIEQKWWLRKNQFSQQHFTLASEENEEVLIENYLQKNRLIVQSDYFNDSLLEFAIFKNIDKPAHSPFSYAETTPDLQKPDSVFQSTFINSKLSIDLSSAYLQIRKIKTTKNQVAGFFTYSENSLLCAVECMSYICSNQELLAFKDSAKAENAFNKFWKKSADNDEEKALLLKNEFVRRVDYANKHFSAYKLGCLTDRGMIYIVYGDPERILNESSQEIWSYKASGLEHLNFVFTFDQQQIAPNNYYLERSQSYRSGYYVAVEKWRNGLIVF